MKLWVMRHGQTTDNIIHVLNCDRRRKVHLSEHGKAQVMQSAQKLKKVKFDAIYCSQYIRARETAGIVNTIQKVRIIPDKRLNELNMGYDNRPFADFVRDRAQGGDVFHFKLKGKESYADVKRRLRSFLLDLEKKPYKNVLIVTHGGVVSMACALFGTKTDEDACVYDIPNAQWMVFDMKDLEK